ncbi:ATP-binding protein [Nonomuraea zeae]|uniref:ATP-binding protein n=1 Tax=Nonomuraea zeae TaxID=1642303 RepID=A0A5S4GJN4_9ACTN|nr:ATP-binding protein [Nonomuraea zeae]TMR33079.1 ATP-binding protein [Nonomuraea zeae]
MGGEFELRCAINEDLALIRDLARIHAWHAGLRGRRLDDLVLAVNEVAANVLEHGGGAGRLVAVAEDGGLTVRISDVKGTLSPEHLAAARAGPSGARGLGLWLACRLCDEVELDHPGGGARLSLRVHGPVPSRPARAERESAAGPGG